MDSMTLAKNPVVPMIRTFLPPKADKGENSSSRASVDWLMGKTGLAELSIKAYCRLTGLRLKFEGLGMPKPVGSLVLHGGQTLSV